MDIPDIFDVLEGGENEDAVKMLIGFGESAADGAILDSTLAAATETTTTVDGQKVTHPPLIRPKDLLLIQQSVRRMKGSEWYAVKGQILEKATGLGA